MFEFEFFRNATLGLLLLSITLPPLGCFIIARRMSLMGDAISHALLPGIVIATLIFGASNIAILSGALVAGLLIALLTPWLSKLNNHKDEASFAALTLLFLSLGVALSPLSPTQIDLTHILFGSILGLDNSNLWVMAGVALINTAILAVIYRKLIIDTTDPLFLKLHFKYAWLIAPLFLMLVVLAMVASFNAIGTMLAVGLMLLPALTARNLTHGLFKQIFLGMALSFTAGFMGLVCSFTFNLNASAAILLAVGAVYLVSLIFNKGRRHV